MVTKIDTSDDIVIKWEGDYSAYGMLLTGDIENLWLPLKTYALHEHDIVSGLVYAQARWYDPETGSFISEDPIKDGNNYYAYCGGNPIGMVDPTGLYGEHKGWDTANTDSPYYNSYMAWAESQGDRFNSNTGQLMSDDEYRRYREGAATSHGNSSSEWQMITDAAMRRPDSVGDGIDWSNYSLIDLMNRCMPTNNNGGRVILVTLNGTILIGLGNFTDENGNKQALSNTNYYMASENIMSSIKHAKEMGKSLGIDENNSFSFVWDGGNNIDDRKDAINNIYGQMTEGGLINKNDTIIIVGHSHGGNVGVGLSNKLTDAGYNVGKLFTLSTPTRSDYPPNGKYSITSFYNPKDSVQTVWARFDTIGNSIIYNGHTDKLINKGLYFTGNQIIQNVNIMGMVDSYISNGGVIPAGPSKYHQSNRYIYLSGM